MNTNQAVKEFKDDGFTMIKTYPNGNVEVWRKIVQRNNVENGKLIPSYGWEIQTV